MRILMLSQFYAPFVGGEERHVQDLSAALSAHGHEVAIVTLSHPGQAAFEMDGKVRVYRVAGIAQRTPWVYQEASHRHVPPFVDPLITRALSRIIQRERPDIVHAHNWLVYSFLPLKRASRAKLILSVHDHSFRCPKRDMLYRNTPCTGPQLFKCLRCAGDLYGIKAAGVVLAHYAMRAYERRNLDLILTVSRAAAAGNALPETKVPYRVIPNFLLDDVGTHIDTTFPGLDQLPQTPYLLFVGALNRFKGIEVLLKAYVQLLDPPPLVLIGYKTGDRIPALEAPPEGVTILQSWPHEAVMAAWQRAYAAVVPSLVPETFGLVALEAMTSGKPVVASQIGGLVDLVEDGVNGFLVPPGDVDALVGALKRLVDGPERAAALGNAGREKSASFKAGVVVPQIIDAYTQA